MMMSPNELMSFPTVDKVTNLEWQPLLDHFERVNPSTWVISEKRNWHGA
jgi:hypothetical protein